MDVSQKILSDITVHLKYAKHVPELNRRETWEELVERNKQMHVKKFPSLEKEINQAYELVLQKKILPSMRSMQFAGKPIEMNNTRIFNCAYLPIDDWRAFQEVMFLLLGGTGVGFSVQQHHIEKLPEIRKPNPNKSKRFLVGDSIEGWADAVKALMKSYFKGGESIRFDFRDIRPKGARLITTGGKAPGPDPLRICLVKVEAILSNKQDGDKLTSIEVYDIINFLADAVLAGGIRRAALICLFSADDEEMIASKSGAWWELNPQRGRSNNSAVILRYKATKLFFNQLWEKIKLSGAGEPGIYFSNDRDSGTNPCCEIALKPNQFCLTGDTQVLTVDGYKSISSLYELNKNVKLISAYDSDLKKASDETSFSSFESQIYKTGEREVYEIKLLRGPSIRATGNHSFLTQDGYVQVKDLDLSYHNLLLAQDNNQKLHTSLVEYNEFDFLGWLIGDGWFTNNPNQLKNVYENMGLVFGSKDDDFAKEKLLPIFKNLLQEAIDKGVARNKDFSLKENIDKNGVSTYVAYSTKARYIANKFGLFPGTAKDKKFPQIFWETTPENRARVLSALFSADGGVQNSHGNKLVRVALSNPLFAEQIQLALSEFGICSRITISERKHSSRCHTDVQVIVSGKQNIINYKNNIGFRLHPRKNHELNQLLESYIENRKNLTNCFEIEYIESVGVEEVFDITTSNSHNFIANGIITHNCNLVEVNASDIQSQEDFNQRVKAATFIGTLQASYTDFHYLRSEWKRTTEKEALLGVSMTGIASMEVFKYDIEQATNMVREENQRVAKLISINSAARLTCVKPAGTTSLVLGTSSGIHAWHNDYYIRRIRIGKNESLYTYLSIHHPELIKDEIFRPHDTAVIEVPQRAPQGSVTRTESALDLLERVKKISQQWVKSGHISGSNTHNVSATISIKDEEWGEVGEWMWKNREYYNGLACLPFDGGSYQQAPFSDITEDEYNELVKHLNDIDLSKVIEIEDKTDLKGELACAGGACEIV